MIEPTSDEIAYDQERLRQFVRGEARAHGLSRRSLLRLLALATGPGAAVAASAVPARAGTPGIPTIVKPLPPEVFTVRGTNAETNFEALAGLGRAEPASHFFVRNHTATPRLDAANWRLRVFGDGLRSKPSAADAVTFDYHDLRRLPARTLDAFVECAGNGRSFYTTQQGQAVSGTAWRLGAIGQARWRGVPLSTVLRRAGITGGAIDVMPQGLDDEYVANGENLGRVRRPLPVAKALDDVLVAYEMNGAPLPPDHGYPVRLIVPSWVGIASIKWVGDIEVSTSPLLSPWNTQFYRLFGDTWPGGASPPLTTQVTKSAFELAWNAALDGGGSRRVRLTGRSWSGQGRVTKVEVSTDGATTWRRARLLDAPARNQWVRWEYDWRRPASGPAILAARATDETGATQPASVPPNTQGYLFGAVVLHPVTVT
ncbi:sulfite oxidase [Frankia nepalensis]|uniref:sulfite oxidase n=1 Tax=Frankia nepalensis TaxID=1836974 RepID=UPI0019311809|nr:sulfite oxidase [Frankia nepalensis]MBL7509291.1 sulfite oxidase [Frankia nepalensis]